MEREHLRGRERERVPNQTVRPNLPLHLRGRERERERLRWRESDLEFERERERGSKFLNVSR
jgi:hypothetical protein